MKKIKNVLICGLGGVGCVYGEKILSSSDAALKILVDETRLEKYSKTPRTVNGKVCDFGYILPDADDFKADLIIISTKSSGLQDAIRNIRNFVSDDTIILSFLNGITSEEEISKVYGEDKVLYSYVICHTIFRTGSNVVHDGVIKTVFGSKNPDDPKIEQVKTFFENARINFEIPNDIIRSMWLKFTLNCCVNQVSAICGKTFSQMREDKKCMEFMKKICEETSLLAKLKGVKNTENFWAETVENINYMLPEGKSSMLQDIEAKRMPEVDLFGKTVVKLSGEYGVKMHYNEVISGLIDIIAE